MKNAEKNEIIAFSDSDVKRLYILKVGTVKICTEDESGKEIISEILTEGDIFGHFHNNTSTKNEYAQVISPSVRVCYFDYNNFKQVMQNKPSLSVKLSDTINERRISFQQKYEDLIFKSTDQRVVEFFKRYASYHGKYTSPSIIEMDMMLTHQDIADYIAASRQSVTTMINRMVKSGQIRYVNRTCVEILDLENLRTI
jgi:CRP-like cAMP-binding protein